LRDYQNELWTDFPLSAKEFEQESRHFAKFRNGTEAFLEACADLGIKVFVASCGIDAYILPTLAELPEKAQRAIAGLRCNQAVFESKQLKQIQMPSLDGPYSLDKGAWCQEIRNLNSRPCEILGIGNGTSDRSMVGFTDRLAATESLAEHLEEKKIDHSYFESFSELVPLLKEARWA
jgi:2-hydroxy-3-keto-5-methylthiopentenyl-1-phosphate phosphatase